MPLLPLPTLFRVKVKGSTGFFWQDGVTSKGGDGMTRLHLCSHTHPGLHQTLDNRPPGTMAASSFPYESDPIGLGGRDKGC